MSNRHNTDERVIMLRRKIGSEAFSLLYIGLLISIIIQQQVFKAPFVQYAVEFYLFIFAAIYVLIRNYFVGNNMVIFKNQVGVVFYSILSGSVVATLVSTFNILRQGKVAWSILVFLITFFSASLFSFPILQVIYIVNKRKQENLEEDFSED